jgi:phosphoglycerate dehydrogenase-like enzyme
MERLLKSTKRIIVKIINFHIKERWNNQSRLKILISINDYFNKASWKQILIQRFSKDHSNWDIVYCRNKFEIIKHFPDADICFLYGYGSLLTSKETKPKLLYFPSLGLEFLNYKNIPQNYRIEKPPAYSAKAIAEYCIAMTILISRNIHKCIYNQQIKTWDQKYVLQNSLFSLDNMKIGILGIGNVGRGIAELYKKHGCLIVGCDKLVRKELGCIDKWFHINALKDFLAVIDVLIIALPLNEETKNIIGIQELKFLKKTSYLINISRGNIINEKELVKALKNKIIKGAVLDSFIKEPLPRKSDFYNLDNLIITPHIAGNFNLFVEQIQEDFLLKIKQFSEKCSK